MITAQIKSLVQRLQLEISRDGLTESAATDATSKLAGLGFSYDRKLYPEIPSEISFSDKTGEFPGSLAEALLWKMGKWNIYTDFVRNYSRTEDPYKSSGIVFSAFAKHLKNRNKPIYDQHALRGLWAINANLSAKERMQCKSVLFKSKGANRNKWKAYMSGTENLECYSLFVKHMQKLAEGDLPLSVLDKLLVPLGQSLKSTTKTYHQFSVVCGWIEK